MVYKRGSALRCPLALVAVAGLASAAVGQSPLEEPFPAVFELPSLLPAQGGDGSLGFVVAPGRSAALGDINGDGVDDLVLGAPETQPGKVFVLFGRADGVFAPQILLSGITAPDGFAIEASQSPARAGWAVSAGDSNETDFDGDGLGDVLVGAPEYGRGGPGSTDWEGRGFVLLGRRETPSAPLVLAAEARAALLGERERAQVGYAAAWVGDLNGDGLADAGFGAPGVRPGPCGPGDATDGYVLFGAATGPGEVTTGDLAAPRGVRLTAPDCRRRLGMSIAAAGDVNGDGLDDAIIGSPGGHYYGSTLRSEAFVVFGRAGGFPDEVDLTTLDGDDGFAIRGPEFGYALATAVAGVGDLNGDGLDDIAVSDPTYSGGGRAYVLFGRAGGFPARVSVEGLSGADGFLVSGTSGRLGQSLAAAGDVNGDGLDDMIVGEPSNYGTGLAHVIFGRAGAFPPSIDADALTGDNGFTLASPPGAADLAGELVAGAGDVNGDGADDLVVSAPLGNGSGPGRAYVVFGRRAEPRCVADQDGDGISDCWETDGVDLDGDGEPEIDLPAMGANPRRKTIFVELDAMENVTVFDDAIQDVIDAFAMAPVGPNPDGSMGIDLRVIIDERVVPFAEEWSKVLTEDFAHAKEVGTDGKGFFGLASERRRSDWPAIEAARYQIFRYGIVANALPGTTIGKAEIPGDDFMIALGGFEGDPQQGFAYALMHELGHTLGLRHGGGDDIVFKPNYVSAMNYNNFFILNTPAGLPRWDFSREALGFLTPDGDVVLDEADLDESAGVPTSLYAGVRVPFGFQRLFGLIRGWGWATLGRPVDWDRDGNRGETGVEADLNWLPDSAPPGASSSSGGQRLSGHDDWPVVANNLGIGTAPGFGKGRYDDSAAAELEWDAIEAIAADLPSPCDADLDGDGELTIFDFLAFQNAFDAEDPVADFDNDGALTIFDFLAFQNEFDLGCP